MSEEDVLIDPNDFVSYNLLVQFENTTTNTRIGNGERSYGSASAKKTDKSDAFHVHFVEFLEKGMVLEAPSKTCAAGHNLTIQIVVEGAKEPIRFSATVRVDEVKPTKLLDGEKDARDEVNVTLVQYEENDWQDLCGLYGKRQEEILSFFEAAKGR